MIMIITWCEIYGIILMKIIVVFADFFKVTVGDELIRKLIEKL